MTNYFMAVLKILGNDERRKARNLLLKPMLQIKLPLYILFLSFTFGALAMLLGYFYFEQLYLMMLENTTSLSMHMDGRTLTPSYMNLPMPSLFLIDHSV